MASQKKRRHQNLGRAEQAVMDHVWQQGPVSAEECREALRPMRPMKESTMRTVLSRLEAKGYVRHTTRGRTYLYEATEPPLAVATRAVQQIADRFCAGSAEALVVGMVDNAVLKPAELERLLRLVAERKRGAR